MPIYAYRCPACQADFEVSRRLADRTAPAFCPADGAEGKRLLTVPNVGGLAADPAMAPPPSGTRAANKWNHFGHSHTGGGSHSHGAPPTPPAEPPST